MLKQRLCFLFVRFDKQTVNINKTRGNNESELIPLWQTKASVVVFLLWVILDSVDNVQVATRTNIGYKSNSVDFIKKLE